MGRVYVAKEPGDSGLIVAPPGWPPGWTFPGPPWPPGRFDPEDPDNTDPGPEAPEWGDIELTDVERTAGACFYIEGLESDYPASPPPYPPSTLAYSGATDAPHVYNWYKYNGIKIDSIVMRTFINFTIPAGFENAAAIFQAYALRGSSPFNLSIFKLTTPVGVPASQGERDAAWSAARTLLGTFGTEDALYGQYSLMSFYLSGFSAGNVTLMIASQNEINGIRPANSYDALYLPQVYAGFTSRLRLIGIQEE